MTRRKRFWLFILSILVVLSLAVFLTHEVLLKYVTQRTLTQTTGLHVTIDELHHRLRDSMIEIRNLRVLNPDTFVEPLALEIEHLRIQYTVRSLFSRKVHFPLIELVIARIILVQQPDGDLNFARLIQEMRARITHPTPQSSQPSQDGMPYAPRTSSPPGQEAPSRELLIQQLMVSIGTAEYHRYRADSATPDIQREPLNWQRTYENVSNLQQISESMVHELVARQMSRGIGRLVEKHGPDLGLDQDHMEKAGRVLRRLIDKRQPAMQ